LFPLTLVSAGTQGREQGRLACRPHVLALFIVRGKLDIAAAVLFRNLSNDPRAVGQHSLVSLELEEDAVLLREGALHDAHVVDCRDLVVVHQLDCKVKVRS
jgi:hypothetical protein